MLQDDEYKDPLGLIIWMMAMQIGECAAMWWRPNFETLLYPYQPPHITKPKVLFWILCLLERLVFITQMQLPLFCVDVVKEIVVKF